MKIKIYNPRIIFFRRLDRKMLELACQTVNFAAQAG